MNKLGQYNNDERGHYTFNYTDTNDSKHVSISFRAEPDYDLDIIFAEIKNFLIASGHDIQGDIGELGIDGGDYEDGDEPPEALVSVFATRTEDYENYKKEQVADKFSMDHLPNNGWPFGGLTSASIPALTTADFASLTVTDLQTLSTQGYADWAGINKYATMAPITQEQIQSWKMPAPGTLGGAKVKF